MAWLIRDGFDWSGRTSRRRYLLVLGLFAAVLVAALLAGRLGSPLGPATVGLFVLAGLLLYPFTGFMVRRCHDTGHSGAWATAAFVPALGGFLHLFLVLMPPRKRPVRNLGRGAAVLGRAAVLGMVALLLARAVWAPYWAPSGSMKPTLLVGDYFLVTRLSGDPRRGDVLVFRHPVTGVEHIKRLIGLPGDTVALRDGQVLVNGAALPVTENGDFVERYVYQGPSGALPVCVNSDATLGGDCLKHLHIETLPGGKTYRTLDINSNALDDRPELAVPDQHYFFLGDNRDNSLDSRVSAAQGGIGFVPQGDLVGKARIILFSAAGRRLTGVLHWRSGRFFKVIE